MSTSVPRPTVTGRTNATTTAITAPFRTLGSKRSFHVRKRLFAAGIYYELSGRLSARLKSSLPRYATLHAVICEPGLWRSCGGERPPVTPLPAAQSQSRMP